MTRRVVVVVAAVLAVLFGTVAPARADGDLAVTVTQVTPGQVRLVAAIPGASATQIPQVTVSRDGWLLPSTVQLDQPDLSPEAQLRTVVVVLDTSTAMAGAGLRAAQAGLLAFANTVPADVAIGLVVAAAQPSVVVRPTRDREAFRTALAALRPAGDTAIYSGLRAAADLGTDATDRQLLVVTGSRDTADGPGTVVRDLTTARQRVDLVSIGGVPNGLGELRNLVSATGGTVRPAANPDALTGVLRTAAAMFPPLVTIAVTVPAALTGAATLMVTAGTGAGKTSTEVEVRFASVPTAESGPQAAHLPTPQQALLGALVFGSLLLAMLLVASRLGETARRRRLKQVEQFRLAGRGPRVSGQTVAEQPEGGFARIVLGLTSRARAGGAAEQPAHNPHRAGVTVPRYQWTAVRLGASVVGAVLFGLLGGLIGVLLGTVFGWLIAELYPRLRERRRRRAFADQLPDSLQLIVGSLRSGFSLAQSIDAVVQDSPPSPLTVELGRAMGEVRLGSDLDDALERVAQRLDNDDLAWAVMAVRIQRDTGGNLAEVLETTVETLRERDRLRRHVRALSAEGRLSAYILIGLPFGLAAFLFLVRRDYLSTLWTTSLGLTMLVGAAGLMAVGTVWMLRWMKVEV